MFYQVDGFSKNKDFYDFVVDQEKNWKEVKIYNLYKLIIKSFIIRILSSRIIFNSIFQLSNMLIKII